MDSNDMADQSEGKKSYGRLRKAALWGAGVALLVIAALYLLLNVVLNTPQATGRISRLLSDTLHQPAKVEGVNLVGGTFFIRGLTIGNPPAFSGGNLLVARTITVTPSWSALLAGRKSFTAIGIRGLKLSLAKNSAGAWNFSGLKELFGKKKSAGETFIKRLVLENSAVSVNGRGITDISLAINNFSTKGSTGSGILLTFNDDFGSPYRLEGGARLGVNPSLDLSLSAPSLSFKVLRKFKLPLDPENGKGKLLLKAQMHGDQFKLDGNAAFDRLTLLLKGEDVPLTGALDFSAAYDVKEDTATLERCALQVDGLIRLKARGRMERVKKERAFTAELSHDGMEVNNLFALLPQKLRRDLKPGGTVLPGSVRIAGNSRSRCGFRPGHVCPAPRAAGQRGADAGGRDRGRCRSRQGEQRLGASRQGLPAGKDRRHSSRPGEYSHNRRFFRPAAPSQGRAFLFLRPHQRHSGQGGCDLPGCRAGSPYLPA